MKPLRLGTRGSALALAQARQVRGLLAGAGLDAEIITIRTTGDRLADASAALPPPVPRALRADASLAAIGGKGVFTKELEDALLENRVDMAVHSLKDLPTELAAGLALGAVLAREDPRDALVTPGAALAGLPAGSVIGTSSLRRRAQLRAARPDLRVEELRGNLDTRLRRVSEGRLGGIVVALAGLRRLGREAEAAEILSLEVMLPAPGQGFIGIEVRAGDVEGAAAALHHGPGGRAASAERAFLAALGGGCRVPIAAYAREEGGDLVLDGLVAEPEGGAVLRGRRSGPPDQADSLGRELARDLLARGAAGLLASTRGGEERRAPSAGSERGPG